ncbi:MAG: prepilin-type N-terminal cleavage/methylation domain-containing protein [Candidatus Terrybacteria bacterium]|nr:prepilin-type N-terminal cleavage/methylation domain-containing protein [Candidatus Terrybacteria bacterium]
MLAYSLTRRARGLSRTQPRGFTLLELLIVIAVIVVLAGILILILNPAETLARSRDAQRIADLNSLKTALGIYVTSVASPDLDAAVASFCAGTPDNVDMKIGYSFSEANGTKACTADVAEGTDVDAGNTFDSAAGDFCVTNTTPTLTDGTGWVPVNLGGITGGSPLSNLPLDPTNTMADATPDNTDLVYRYACQNNVAAAADLVFEFNTILESAAYATVGAATNRMETDGGDNTSYLEVGTSVRLIGGGTNF